MLDRFFDRIVDRSVPVTEDDDERRIAEEAAENAVRQTLRLVGAGSVVFLTICAAILFTVFASRLFLTRISNAPFPSEPSGRPAVMTLATGTVDAPKTRTSFKIGKSAEASEADLDTKLDDFTKAWEDQVAQLTQALREDIKGLKRQVADLAISVKAMQKKANQPPKQYRQASHKQASLVSRPLAKP